MSTEGIDLLIMISTIFISFLVVANLYLLFDIIFAKRGKDE